MNGIFKYLIVALLAFLPAEYSAKASSPLERLYESLSTSCVMMKCDYTMTVGGITSKGDCAVELQGACYKIQGGGLDITSDGESVWVLDQEAREVIIEPVSDDSYYLSNPVLLLKDMYKVFTITDQTATASGVRYVLRASEPCGIEKAVLLISNDAALLSAEFTLDDKSLMEFDVRSTEVSDKKGNGYFSRSSFSSDWIVMDLR